MFNSSHCLDGANGTDTICLSIALHVHTSSTLSLSFPLIFSHRLLHRRVTKLSTNNVLRGPGIRIHSTHILYSDDSLWRTLLIHYTYCRWLSLLLHWNWYHSDVCPSSHWKYRILDGTGYFLVYRYYHCNSPSICRGIDELFTFIVHSGIVCWSSSFRDHSVYYPNRHQILSYLWWNQWWRGRNRLFRYVKMSTVLCHNDPVALSYSVSLCSYSSLSLMAYSEWMYLVTGAAFNLICALGFLYLIQSPFTRYWLNQRNEKDVTSTLSTRSNHESLAVSLLNGSKTFNLNDSLSGAATTHYQDEIPEIFPKLDDTPMEGASYKVVLRKIWKIALAVFLVFYVTLLMFPGLLSGIDSQFESINSQQWMPVLLTVSRCF